MNLENNGSSPVRIAFIINPISGVKKKERIERMIRENFDPSLYQVRISHTAAQGHAVVLAREAVEEGYGIVVAVGGDGTVNETGQALIGRDVVLGIIPAGSGNGLARHLKIPFRPEKAMEILRNGRVAVIDSATMNDKVFLNMAGVGYDAHVAKIFSQSEKRGFLTYFRIVSSEYPRYKPKKFRMVIDGKEVVRKALMVSFANSSQFGNNTVIDPMARVDDGLIDVCIVRKVPLMLLPAYLPALFLKFFHKTHIIEIIRAKEVFLTREEGKSVNIDGEYSREEGEIRVKIHPLSVKILVPK